MNTRIFEAFNTREKQVSEYMAGCGMRYGMQCTCGPSCRCKDCPMHSTKSPDPTATMETNGDPVQRMDPILELDEALNQMGQRPTIDMFGMELPHGVPTATATRPQAGVADYGNQNLNGDNGGRSAQRNPSLLSYRNSFRHMSITSETTFGRAMSGLSALSIDWENLEDFDLELDHSAHINDAGAPKLGMEVGGGGNRRSSLRRSIMSTGDEDPSMNTFKP